MSVSVAAPVDLSHRLAPLAAVDLDELIAVADLQTRRDRKYLLPAATALDVIRHVRGRVLEIDGRRTFRYESIYFDTDAWDSYLGAAHRRPRRFKVRTRSYLDSGECMLEVKVRDARGNTVKHRLPYDLGSRDRLTGNGERFVASIDASAAVVDGLRPSLQVAYRRSTLVLDGCDARVTLDQDARWSADGRPDARLQGLVLVETKTSGRPCTVDRLLWRTGHRPVTISKYCTGLAALHPELPSNKWHRVLHRRLLPALEPSSVATDTSFETDDPDGGS